MEIWFYVSLSDGEFAMGCFVQALSPEGAEQKAHDMRGKCHRSALVMPVSDEQMKEKVPEHLRNVPLTKEQIEEVFGVRRLVVEVSE